MVIVGLLPVRAPQPPLIYSTPAEEYYENWGKIGEVYCYIYMADGTVKKLIKE